MTANRSGLVTRTLVVLLLLPARFGWFRRDESKIKENLKPTFDSLDSTPTGSSRSARSYRRLASTMAFFALGVSSQIDYVRVERWKRIVIDLSRNSKSHDLINSVPSQKTRKFSMPFLFFFLVGAVENRFSPNVV